jgi:general secretion pathway protein F
MEFRIKALDGAHSVVSCVLDAVDESDARRQLELRELKVIALSPLRRLRPRMFAQRMPLAVFSQQLVSLLDAGLSLVEALEALAEKESGGGSQRVLERVLARLYEGQTFATALAEHPGTFPQLYIASVRASEAAP